jgi:hypothetical protein
MAKKKGVSLSLGRGEKLSVKQGAGLTAKGRAKYNYANINAKRARIKAGSGEQMREVGAKGAPTAKAFKQSLRTAKRKS